MLAVQNTKREYSFFVFESLTIDKVYKEISYQYAELSKGGIIPTVGEVVDQLHSLYHEGISDILKQKIGSVEHVLGYSESDKTVKPVPINNNDAELFVSALQMDPMQLKRNFIEDVSQILINDLSFSIVDSFSLYYSMKNMQAKSFPIKNNPILEVW